MRENRDGSTAVTTDRVLVTGADGFVGRHVCGRLAGLGRVVRGMRRSAPVGAFDGIEYRTSGDIALLPDWTAALDGVSVVVHAAGRAHAPVRKGSLDRCRRVNVQATAHLARAAAASGVRRFIHLSSLLARPLDRVQHPERMPYAASKREAEAVLAEVAATTPMEVVVLRPPLVYGPGVAANFRLLLRAAERGWPLPLAWVDNRRSFIFVGNLADAVAVAAAHPEELAGTFELSDGAAVSVPDLLRAIATAMGKPVRLLPFPPGFLRAGAQVIGQRQKVESVLDSLVADDTAFREATGWSPPFTLAEGLAATLGRAG